MKASPGVPYILSPAAINRFRSCPKSFYYADVERLPRGGDPSPVLAQGNAIHHALELFFRLRVEDRSVDLLHKLLKSHWRKHAPKSIFSSDFQEADYGRRALELLSLFWANHDTTVVPRDCERQVEATLPNGMIVRGKVDRIDPAPDGGIEVIDYKTGRRRVEPEDLADEPAAQVYLLAAEATYGIDVERIRFLFLATGEEIIWSPDREEVEETRQRLARLTSEITSTHEFEAYPGPQCNWCPFSGRCPDRNKVRLDQLAVPADLPF